MSWVRFGRVRGRGRIVVFGLVVVVVIVATLARRPSPARWTVKTPEEWFNRFRVAGGAPPAGLLPRGVPARMVVGSRAWTVAVGPGTTRMAFGDSPELMLRDPSAEGLRGLGTNAAIFLDGELRRKDLPFAGKYARLYAKVPAVLTKILPAPAEPSALVRRDAAVALAALGTNAWPAVPGLISALTKVTMADWDYFRAALKRLPFEDETWDPGLDFFTRQKDDYNGIELVRSIHSRTRMAAQVVANGLLSTNNYVVEAALDEVGGFGQRAE